MSENWDDYADHWDRDEDVRSYADQAFASLIERAHVHDDCWKSKRALDFGCGTGLLTEKLSPHVREIVAVDLSEKMIAVLNKKSLSNVTAINANIGDRDIRRGPAWRSGFHLITASSVCSFLPDYEQTLSELSPLLTAGGLFAQWDWLSEMPIERIRTAFEASGLESVVIETAFEMAMNGDTMPVVFGLGRASR